MSEAVRESAPAYRVPRRGMDPTTKRLAIIATGLGGVLLLILGASNLKGHGERPVPVVEADTRPLRVKPENPGGMQIAGANDEIMSGDAGTEADKLLPPPEVPMPEALRPPAPPEPAVAAHARTAPGTAEPPVAGPAVAGPAVADPVPNSRPSTAAAPEHRAPAKAASIAPATANATQVQLAAMESEQLATAEWQRLLRRMPDVLGGRQPAVLKAERDGKTIWRLRTGGFSDAAQANAFCERVKSKGAGCSVASF